MLPCSSNSASCSSASTSGSNDSVASAQGLGGIAGGGATSLTVEGFVGTADMAADDVDFYSFTVTEAGTFYFDIDNGFGNASSVDTQLFVFDGTTVIAENDDSFAEPGSASTLDSFIVIEAHLHRHLLAVHQDFRLAGLETGSLQPEVEIALVRIII